MTGTLPSLEMYTNPSGCPCALNACRGGLLAAKREPIGSRRGFPQVSADQLVTETTCR